MRWMIGALMLAASVPTMAAASAPDDLKAVIADHWAWYLSVNPTLASTLGDHRGDGKLSDISLAAADAQAAQAAALLRRLEAIPDAGLSIGDRVNKAILRRMLDEQITGNGFPERMMIFTSYANPWQGFAGLADDSPFASGADYRSYIDRLRGYPALAAQVIAVGGAAIQANAVQPCEAIGGVAPSIAGLIADTPETTRYFQPFLRARPADTTPEVWGAFQAAGKAAIRDIVIPQNRRLLGWLQSDYLPKCRKTPGAMTLPRGPEWYAWRVKAETTTEMTPEQVHQLGLSEVARIRAEMDAVAVKAGYASRQAMIATMKSDPKYFARTPEELLAAASRVAKTIDGKMPTLFVTLPRLPYGVRAIPAETAEGTTTAYYSGGSPASGIAGTYYVNTSKLNQRPLWELPALTSHEAVPGHHNQIALQQELDLPEFRRHAAFFTAFTEGWGLYAERLGIDIGLYDTPEKDMGRLSYEMWRACRLVVDTGIHAKGWSKAQAVQFMKDNSALTDANIDAEVNRYISWPGQALGYKIGELRIRALRAKAEKALGPRFDLRRFNDAVIAQGSVPMDVLEAQIDAWIVTRPAG
jgi:uncharacterized protein (DUF885 family)